MEVRKNFLVESALLTHGLPSISNDEMLGLWPAQLDNIVWVDGGELMCGGMEQFVSFRSRAQNVTRIDCFGCEKAMHEGVSGALTASGTMEICRRLGLPLAVSCGIGGIGDIKGEELCPDLPALATIPVALLCTSPKDMLDIPGTFAWLREHDIAVIGVNRSDCTGYMFRHEPVEMDGRLNTCGEYCRLETDGDSCAEFRPCAKQLILNAIPEEKRLENQAWLQMGIDAGLKAEREGRFYHPAANAEYDRLSEGKAARIQFEGLIENALIAMRITE